MLALIYAFLVMGIVVPVGADLAVTLGFELGRALHGRRADPR